MEPTLLIASPQMRDPFFERTVVLLWHHDEEGAIGVVINRFLDHTLPEVLEVGDEVDLKAYDQDKVAWGGPVEGHSGTIVTRGEITADEGWVLDCGINVTRSHDALLRLLEQGADVILALGYAGWGPGQLDREIEQGGWLCTDALPELVFDSPIDKRYEQTLATLGLTTSTVWMQPIDE